MLNSLMGETVKYLPLACEWEEIPEAYKAHIFPTLEGDRVKLWAAIETEDLLAQKISKGSWADSFYKFRAAVIPYKTDQDSWMKVVQEYQNRQNMSGKGRVTGWWSHLPAERGPHAFPDV
ncbi:hypothetical protein Tco_0228845 [Tanacetum coccineum]